MLSLCFTNTNLIEWKSVLRLRNRMKRLFFELNILRMSDGDVVNALTELVDSLKNRDVGLYNVLVKILRSPHMIKRIEPSWKNIRFLVSDPKTVQILLSILWGVINRFSNRGGLLRLPSVNTSSVTGHSGRA